MLDAGTGNSKAGPFLSQPWWHSEAVVVSPVVNKKEEKRNRGKNWENQNPV